MGRHMRRSRLMCRGFEETGVASALPLATDVTGFLGRRRYERQSRPAAASAVRPHAGRP